VRSRVPLILRDSIRSAASTSTDEFELGEPGTGPSLATRFLIRRVVTADTAATRRRNYETLLERLPGRVARPFGSVPDGAAPFVFPLDTRNKHAVLQTLSTQGIQAFDFWSFGHPLLETDSFPAIQERRRRTIGLPVHQELRPQDVERIAAVVARAVATEGA
jgi:hypothetical protein